MICSRQGRSRQPVVPFCATTSNQPTHLSNPILRATLIGAFATATAQLVGCPLDVISKLGAKNVGANIMLAGKLVRNNGILALYKGLPFHLMKRTPTKALTVCLFEMFRSRKSPTTKAGHIKTALLSGMLALAATYPATVLYYGRRKAIPFAAIMERIRNTSGGVLYAGFIPAVTAVAPSVAIDYSIYHATREHLIPPANAGVNDNINTGGGNNAVFPLGSVMVAAAISNMVAGGFAEPLKMIARRSAVSALKGGNSTRMVAIELIKGGPGELWKGFPRRSFRYALTAVVSKTTMQRLREIDAAGAYRAVAL